MTSKNVNNIQKNKAITERRRQIFDTAIRLFNQKGVTNTTVREIAEAEGLTVGGLYYYIKSKDEIFNIVIENSKYFHEAIKNWVNSLVDESPAEVFRKCIRYWLTISPTAMEQTIFFEHERMHMDPDMQEKQMEIVRDFIHFIEDLMRKGVDAGEFEIDNIKLLAFQTYMLRGIFATKQWYLKDLITSEEYSQLMTKTILTQILVDKTKIINSRRVG